MELVIITPERTQHVQVTWIEVQTIAGNRVIQPGHTPMLFVLTPGSHLVYFADPQGEHAITIGNGTLEVDRTKATLLLHEE